MIEQYALQAFLQTLKQPGALVLLCLCLPLTACTAGTCGTEQRVAGTVIYRERMALPPDAELVLTVDGRRPDGEAIRIAETRIPVNGRSVPLPFDIRLPDDPYAVRTLSARIMSGSEALFAVPEPLPVPNDPQTSGALVVLTHRVIAGTAADAGGVREPVASRLAGTRWKAVLLHGRPVDVFDDQPEAHLVFHPESAHSGRISGSDGCNALLGTYEINGSALRFSELGATLRLCPQGEEQAAAFRQTLGAATGWRLAAGRLELTTPDGPAVVLESVALK